MTDLLAITLPFLTGSTVGWLFYGGLWLTVCKVVTTKRHPLWLPASLLARTIITLVVFFLIFAANSKNFAYCIVGFILARLLVLQLVFAWKQNDNYVDREGVANAP